jgi:hypothetical protein
MNNGKQNQDVEIIAWVSSHVPLPAQIDELRKKLGSDIKIVSVTKTFDNSRQVAREVAATGAKHAVVVLPLSMARHLIQDSLEYGITWLIPEMNTVHYDECDAKCNFNVETDVRISTRSSKRHLRFVKFEELVGVTLSTKEFRGINGYEDETI